MKLIAFSLWGNNPKYTVGALRNAELAATIYPGWVAKFYVGSSTDRSVVRDLRSRGAFVEEREEPGDYRATFWRFMEAGNPDVEIFISRDCDSRLDHRERAAVDDWIKSGKTLHIMRDHPYHHTEILGGMWGIKGGVKIDFSAVISALQIANEYGSDQNFLKEFLYPKFCKDACVHDTFFERRPFPTPRNGLKYVGQVYDENDQSVPVRRDLCVMYTQLTFLLNFIQEKIKILAPYNVEPLLSWKPRKSDCSNPLC